MSEWYREDEASDGTVTLTRVDLREANFFDKRWHLTHDEGGVHVSTVFLALDHSWADEGPPVVYETMVFGGPLDQEQVRYCTRVDAIDGHNAMILRVRLAGMHQQQHADEDTGGRGIKFEDV
jgi:hypothetical protein